MLVDGGGIPVFGGRARSQLDIGEDVVAPYLWSRSIRRLDAIAMTHAHDDHAQGLPALMADFHPAELWTGATPQSPEWQAVRDAAARNGTRVVAMEAPRRFAFGGTEIEVLAPEPGYEPGTTPKNNDSLVLKIHYGRHTFLLCGDAERQVEYQILDAGRLGHADVLKVAHHGSRTSSTEAFLEAVQPEFALISVGYLNSYGHPMRDVVERLQDHHAEVFRTDLDGQVTVRSDGKRISAQTWRDEFGRGNWLIGAWAGGEN